MDRDFLSLFLSTCALKDFRSHLYFIHLKQWEKKKLIAHLKMKYNQLVGTGGLVSY
jgi:hypothetical protein